MHMYTRYSSIYDKYVKITYTYIHIICTYTKQILVEMIFVIVLLVNCNELGAVTRTQGK